MTESRNSNLILTAASESYGSSVLALIGSLDLNWPQHPPVLVYNIGLDEKTLSILKAHNIAVKGVPHFCDHWRKHFTWKIWCWNDAPAENILWLDAGIVVMRPLDELFVTLDQVGYFVIPTYHSLTENASLQSCECCGVTSDFRNGKMTLAGGIIGFNKQQDIIAKILKEALFVAQNEKCIKATEPLHRHDQAIISLLFYKYLDSLIVLDGIMYGGWISPKQTPGQKIWVHRSGIRKDDENHFIAHISTPGRFYMPSEPEKKSPTLKALLYKNIIRCIKIFYKPKSRRYRIYDGVKD